MNKPKLNQPDVEITTTFNDVDIPESLNVNITIPSDMLKDFIDQQSIVNFKREHFELNHKVYGDIKIESDVMTYDGKVYTAIKPELTLDDYIKEWEKREFRVTEYAKGLLIESKKYDLTLDICKANLIYEISDYFESNPACVSPEIHQLLSKTLKAMEEMKNENS